LRNFVKEIGASSSRFAESSHLALLNTRFPTKKTLALGCRAKLACVPWAY
jgi:hypothetical protein